MKSRDIKIKFNKALYGVMQTLRAWNSRIDDHFLNNEFVKCPYKYVIYVVAPDIVAAHKIILSNYGKRTDFWHLVL
jgi:hypothetical protein